MSEGLLLIIFGLQGLSKVWGDWELGRAGGRGGLVKEDVYYFCLVGFLGLRLVSDLFLSYFFRFVLSTHLYYKFVLKL